MAAPLRFVHVGVGAFGEYWCREVLPHIARLGLAEVVAVVDVDESRRNMGAALLGLDADRAYGDVVEALDRFEPDAVTVVVPPAHHERVVHEAARRGIHVLSEKPIADSMDASVRVHDEVIGAGVKMAVTMSHRFDRDKMSLKHYVDGGEFGPLNYLVYRFTHNCREFGSWGKFRHEIPDPLFIEGSVHHFDIIRALTRSNAATVYARTWNPPWGEYAGDSTGLLIAEMENGVKVLYEGAKANASTMNGWGNDYLRAECESGSLELDRRRLRVLTSDRSQMLATRELALLPDSSAWMNPLIAERFCRWVNGGDTPETAIEDNLQCAAFLFAAVESAHTGQIVDVQRFLAESRDRVERARNG